MLMLLQRDWMNLNNLQRFVYGADDPILQLLVCFKKRFFRDALKKSFHLFVHSFFNSLFNALSRDAHYFFTQKEIQY